MAATDPMPLLLLPTLVALVAVAFVALRLVVADRRWLASAEGANRFWACAIGIAALWHFDGGPIGSLHLLGATVACALLGPRPALLALAAGIAIRHVGDGLPWHAWGPAFLAGALPPVAIAAVLLAIARRVGRRHGPLPVVAASFVAGGASMGVAVGLQAAFGIGPPAVGVGGLAALALAMAVAEANLSAAVLVPIAVCRPEWLRESGRRR